MSETNAPSTTPAPVAPPAAAPPVPGMNDASAPSAREIAAPAASKLSPSQTSIYDEIEALANPGKKPAAKPPETPTESGEEEIPSLLEKEAPAEKPAETPPPKSDKTQPPAQLRKAYEELKAKHAELEKRLAKPPEEDSEKRTLAESLSAREKRIKELEDEQKFWNYERSPEYIEKYQKPYEETAATATARAVKMKVVGEDGQSRNLTDKEFWSIVGISDDDEALAVAEKVTGNAAKAALLVSMRNDIGAKLEAGNRAKEQFRATAAEREKQLAEASARQRVEQEKAIQERVSAFNRLNEEAAKKYPKYFAPEEGDTKGNELLQRGLDMVDAVFGDSSKVPPEKLIQYHSAVRNKAAAFDRLAYKLGRASSKIAALEKELAGFKESGPGNGGTAGRGGSSNAPMSWEQEIDALAAKGRR